MTKRDFILNETAKLFAEKGFALSLSDVGKCVNLQKQSLYNYFPSKDDLIQEMLTSHIEKYQNQLKQTFLDHRAESIKDQLYKIVLFSINYFDNGLELKLRKWVMLLSDRLEMQPIMSMVDGNDEEFRMMLSELFESGTNDGIIHYDDMQMAISSLFILVRGLIDGLNMRNSRIDQQSLIDTLFNEYWRSITT